jgi:RNA polymerase sigma factor (TIGR02999 family)
VTALRSGTWVESGPYADFGWGARGGLDSKTGGAWLPPPRNVPRWRPRGSPTRNLTELLHAWSRGDRAAYDELTARVYERLRQMARRHLARERRGHTLQPTALVHEVYLRLAADARLGWKDRAHFFGACAEVMRRILIDHARRRKAGKRGGGATTVLLEDARVVGPADAAPEIDLLALDEALERLEALDPRQSRIIELRFFAGLSNDEAAEVVGLATRTVKLEWTKARAWLYRELQGDAR